MTLRERILQLVNQYEDEAQAPAKWEMSNAFLLRTVAFELKQAIADNDVSPQRNEEDVKSR